MLGGVTLYAVPGALVERLILELANVGDESELIGAVFGGHCIRNVVGIDGVRKCYGAHHKNQRHEYSKQFLHVSFLLLLPVYSGLCRYSV